jgi:leader peptidase (prepilin peptidase)/N-methyltransferase
LDPFITGVLFVAGLAFGSFLNVCISRIPRDMSIVRPGSGCPQCATPIAWRDNVPVLSWVLLRGRCRSCGTRISLRYPVVELLTAVLFVASYAVFGFSLPAFKAWVLCFLVVGLIFMDAETGLLPHEFTYTGIAIGLASAWMAAFDARGTSFLLRACGLRELPPGPRLWLVDSMLATVIGAGFFYVAWALYYLLKKRQGLGMGDIALIAMLGAFLGLKLIVLVIFLSPILATFFAAGLIFREQADTGSTSATSRESWLRRELPFGAFLGISGLVALFFGEKIWAFYLGLFP